MAVDRLSRDRIESASLAEPLTGHVPAGTSPARRPGLLPQSAPVSVARYLTIVAVLLLVAGAAMIWLPGPGVLVMSSAAPLLLVALLLHLIASRPRE